MAQNESRYDVLKNLIYPKAYFEGVSDGTIIKDWSPNNLRRIFIFENRVYVQWYVRGNKLEGINPFLNYNGIILRSGALRYKEFASANVATENDVNYELPSLLDIVFKKGKDGYKLANIEEVIFVNESQNKYLMHDGRNYNAYSISEYKRYIGITYLEVSSEQEFMKALVENDEKPVCRWGRAKLVFPNKGTDGKCIIQDRKLFNSTFYTHAPGESKSSSGVTYELDTAVRKKLVKIRDEYLAFLGEAEEENERETIDKQIYIKTLNECRKTIVNTNSKLNYGQYISKIIDIMHNDGAYISEGNKVVDSFLTRYFQKTAGKLFENTGTKKYVTAAMFKILGPDADSTLSFYNNLYEIHEKLGVEISIKRDELKNNIRQIQLYIDALILFKTLLKHKAFSEEIGIYNELSDILLSFLNFVNSSDLYNKLGINKEEVINFRGKIKRVGLANSNGLFTYEANGKVEFEFIYKFYKHLKDIKTVRESRYKNMYDEVIHNNKGKFDSMKIMNIMKSKMNVDHKDDLDIEQQEIFDALCVYATYYILLVKYVKRDALKWVNIAMIKSQGIQLRHYLVISQVAQEYIGDDDVSEIINAFSERINVEDDNNDKFSNKGEIHDMYEEIKKLGGILNG